MPAFTVVHRPQHPAFFGGVPHTVAIVELGEGIRLHANVVGCSNEQRSIGMPMEVACEKLNAAEAPAAGGLSRRPGNWTLPILRSHGPDALRPDHDVLAVRAGRDASVVCDAARELRGLRGFGGWPPGQFACRRSRDDRIRSSARVLLLRYAG